MDAFISQIKTSYANWRISPTRQEKHSYNTTEKILLTFDDYTTADRLLSILKILEDENVKAIFFLVGEWTSKNPELVQEIRNAGHWVGNHTKTHANLLKLSKDQVKEEILGGPSSTLLRPPYGKYNARIRSIAKELGYKICYWDIDTSDWQGISKEKILTNGISSLHASACILMHLNGQYTIDALPFLINEIRNRGYKLCNGESEVEND